MLGRLVLVAVAVVATGGVPASTSADAPCALDDGVLTITVDPGLSTPILELDADGTTFRLQPYHDEDLCAGVGATLANTAAIDVSSPGWNPIIEDPELFRGPTGAVIPITIHDGIAPDVQLDYTTPAGPQSIALGTLGINRNADEDAVPDIIFDAPSIFDVSIAAATGAPMHVTAAGGAGTGRTFPFQFEYGAGNGTPSVVTGGSNVDRLYGGTADDTLVGGKGDDIIDGGGGKDTLRGGAGDDTFTADDGLADRVVGGGGSDTARVDCGRDRVRSIESITC